MIFNSIDFVFFFILVTVAYFMLPHRFRWFLLLVASCYFYMAFVPVYILILGFTIVIDYFAGILIENAEGKKRKLYLVMSLVANIGVLAVFKYYNFLNENLSVLLGSLSITNPVPFLRILLPIGLSFHTFQAMSYTIVVYRVNQPAERHFGIYSLYVMFYPQLVAGPIERPQNLLYQFRQKFDFNYDRVVEGLRLVLWGFFKKLVIADRLAMYVNAVYNHPHQHTGVTLILASVFFGFQIYCDFSGYSDIAIGVAKIMGFDLMINFKRPLFAKNMSEFWKRWHISLSTWFRDYLFTPIAVEKRYWGIWAVIYATMITFLVSGIWHGAAWTYIIWGGLHGIYLSFAILTKGARNKINKFIGIEKLPRVNLFFQIIITFALYCFALIFFRANSVADSFFIVKRIFTNVGSLFFDRADPSSFIFSFVGIFILLLIESKREFYKGNFSFFTNKHWLIRHLSYAVLIIIILLIAVFDGGQFIYFQF